MCVLVAGEFDIWFDLCSPDWFQSEIDHTCFENRRPHLSGSELRPAVDRAVVPVERGATPSRQPPENLRADLAPGDLTVEVASLTRRLVLAFASKDFRSFSNSDVNT